ncbi:2-dehydropantoate 2-reductase [Paenibacillus sp. PL2-23]|uniref:ketopantoate reductase family protein n=1 Tax=Paenibacillus sp. PL2-23 TaxID=2100729 RepID=UPI0030FC6030
MRMEIIGGGALGLLLAAKLAASGADVKLWTRTERQCRLIEAKGLTLLDESGETVQRPAVQWLGPEVACDRADGRGDSWVVLAVKQSAIGEELISRLRGLAMVSGQGAIAGIVCLQNGLGHLEKLAEGLPGVPLYASVTTSGAKREDERTVRHTGSGGLWIAQKAENGAGDGEISEKAQKMLLETLRKAGFETFLSNDMEDRIFQKLLINAVINPLTALFDCLNGELPNDRRRYALMEALYQETYGILTAAGMKPNSGSWDGILEVCRRTACNVSSMLADVRAARPTEIEAINGAVSRLARERGMRSPLNDAVTTMIQAYN